MDGALLPDLTNEDPKDLGVARLADRKRLLKAITELSEGDGQSAIHRPRPIPSEGERRQVTVLFADLSNFTQLSNELDAEATHALLNLYFEKVDDIVAAYGGTIDKHIGDNLMAVFGAPLAHTDDPEHAHTDDARHPRGHAGFECGAGAHTHGPHRHRQRASRGQRHR